MHPGGNLGKDLKNLEDVMHVKNAIPLSKLEDKMSKALLIMTQKSFGCIGVINHKKKILVYDVPLIYETRSEKQYDLILFALFCFGFNSDDKKFQF